MAATSRRETNRSRSGRWNVSPSRSAEWARGSRRPAATLLAGSELTIHDLGLNPRRTGLLDVLERMGARISVFNRRKLAGEWTGDLEVHAAELVGTEVD